MSCTRFNDSILRPRWRRTSGRTQLWAMRRGHPCVDRTPRPVIDSQCDGNRSGLHGQGLTVPPLRGPSFGRTRRVAKPAWAGRLVLPMFRHFSPNLSGETRRSRRFNRVAANEIALRVATILASIANGILDLLPHSGHRHTTDENRRIKHHQPSCDQTAFWRNFFKTSRLNSRSLPKNLSSERLSPVPSFILAQTSSTEHKRSAA